MVEVRTILHPSDLSAASDAAFEHARALCESLDASLVLYHAVEVPRSEYGRWIRGHEDEVWATVEEAARRELRRRASATRQHTSVIVQREVSAPSLLVGEALRHTIERVRPDIVVMGTHARTTMDHLLGSVTEEIARHAPCPVLCVRGGGDSAASHYRRILVATDFSTVSERVFPIAAELAGKLGLHVTAIHVARGTDDNERLRARVLGQLGPAFQGRAVDVAIEAGSPWRRIVDVAKSTRADIIAMATRGDDSVVDAILGSNTERVMRYAACPVLVA